VVGCCGLAGQVWVDPSSVPKPSSTMGLSSVGAVTVPRVRFRGGQTGLELGGDDDGDPEAVKRCFRG
jgi:hypothetical protein